MIPRYPRHCRLIDLRSRLWRNGTDGTCLDSLGACNQPFLLVRLAMTAHEAVSHIALSMPPRIIMISQPRQEPFEQAPRGTTSTEQHLTSSRIATPPQEALCLTPEEGLQEESRRLQQCVRELLIENQQLRMLLESANESPGKEHPPLNAPQNIRRDQSHKRSL
jgi:hypothetical protein